MDAPVGIFKQKNGRQEKVEPRDATTEKCEAERQIKEAVIF